MRVYPPFPKDIRSVFYNKAVYFLPTAVCEQDCNKRGACVLGRCTCNNGYHGDYCEFKNCHNSLVYVDIDTISP